jgi:hypothetical protein
MDDEDGVGEAASTRAAKKKSSDAPSPDMAPRHETVGTTSAGGDGDDESAPAEDDIVEMSGSDLAGARPRFHRVLGLTGGFQRFAKHTNGSLQLDGRLEYGVRTLIGVDLAFWAQLDNHFSGNALLSVTQRAIAGHWLDLGLGVGAHVIDHNSGFFGPAWSLSLRVHVPTVKGIHILLRYDGSILRTNDGDPDRHPLTSLTTGFEASF